LTWLHLQKLFAWVTNEGLSGAGKAALPLVQAGRQATAKAAAAKTGVP